MDRSDTPSRRGDKVRSASGRRALLGGLAGLAGTLLLPRGALAHAAAAASSPLPPERTLSLVSLHTGERLTAAYVRGGRYDAGALEEIDQILRDWRSGEVQPMDRGLLDLLYLLRGRVGGRGPFEIISGYRSPKTNAKLASRSGGVAKKSQHMLGKAIDVALPGTALTALHEEALALQSGGVGLYSKSGFLHLDTGRVRRWGG